MCPGGAQGRCPTWSLPAADDQRDVQSHTYGDEYCDQSAERHSDTTSLLHAHLTPGLGPDRDSHTGLMSGRESDVDLPLVAARCPDQISVIPPCVSVACQESVDAESSCDWMTETRAASDAE